MGISELKEVCVKCIYWKDSGEPTERSECMEQRTSKALTIYMQMTELMDARILASVIRNL